VGVSDVVIVAGYRGDRIIERVAELERRSGLTITIIENERGESWNNAYSLWLARAFLRAGAIVANGDTLHPASVEDALIAAAGEDVLLAVDDVKFLGDEEMKVDVDASGCVRRISKTLAHDVRGEYIGVSLVPAGAAGRLTDALERTWRAEPSRYYEDAYQLLVDENAAVRIVSIGDVPWTEIDDDRDLARAKELACRY
jgi:choline kinase